MCLNVLMVPRLWGTDTSSCKVAGLGGLSVGLDVASLAQWDLAVVARAARCGPICDFGTREPALYICGVDARFAGCWWLLVIIFSGH
jgi:hypothetical protein